jgi:glutathione S-transferase
MAADPVIFYHNPQSRASTVHWMLEEAGAPYETRFISLKSGEQREPSYLAVNPMGKVPAIVHKGVVVTESAAICCYLADEFPLHHLAPAIGDPQRGAYLRWLFFAPSCIEPACLDHALKREPANRGTAGYGDYETVMHVTARALTQGPYLLGDRFTAADVVLGSLLRWTMKFKITPELPEFTAYVERLDQRPAYQRAQATDAALMV